jgi:hypothetical protein
MKYGQAQVVSLIIIILLILGAIAFVYPWANSMIQKKKDTKNIDDVYNFFKSLDETIRTIAKNGGEESLSLEVPGQLYVYPASVPPLNNSIVFAFRGLVSNVAEGGWIPLNTPNMNETATLGIDPPSVIFGMANETNKEIEIKYRLWYRELDDLSSNGYKIVLNTSDGNIKSTNTGFMRIQRLGTVRITGGKTLTITEINIIL